MSEPERSVKASLWGVFPNTGSDVTAQLQKAIDVASRSGLCLNLEEGVYQCGTLYLRDHTNLYLPSGCVLMGSGNICDYGNDTGENRYIDEEYMDRCFLYAEDCEDIHLYGGGEINGNGWAFHDEKDWQIPRPMLLRLYRCRNIVIEGLSLVDPASWTCAFLECESITARHLTCRALINLNGDGLDFDGCRQVLVEDCNFMQSDDCICLQNHKKETPMENVIIRRCRMTSQTCAVRIGMSSIGDIRDVHIHHCTLENVWREGIKVESSEGGTIEHLRFEDLIMLNVRRPLYYLCNNRIATKGVNTVPPFGKVARIIAKRIRIIDTPEMQQTHFYTFRGEKCVQGEPVFGGIRCDAPDKAPLEDICFSQIEYLAFGGVRRSQIPEGWPPVPDARTESLVGKADNYYPNWSRAVFLDCRNVQRLKINDVKLRCRLQDEREPVIIENCVMQTVSDWSFDPDCTDE